MKITKSLVLSLFLLAFTTTFPSSSFMASAIHSANDELEPVYDINGQEVQAGGLYFIEVKVPFTPNASSLHDEPFLAFSDITDGFCPAEVVLSTTSKFPVRISTRFGPVVREDSYLTIKFDIDYLCRIYISLIWGIEEYGGRAVLTARGTELANEFVVTKYKDEKYTYQLSYCSPLVGSECRRLGYFVENGVNFVSPNGPSFPIIFRPAPETRQTIKEVVTN